MIVSLHWLKKFVNFSESTEQLAEILTMLGFEAELSDSNWKNDSIVTAKVLSCSSHPNADKLKITKVNIGNEVKQIICGASNIKKGQFVVVVLVGNSLVNQNGESFKIKKTKSKRNR